MNYNKSSSIIVAFSIFINDNLEIISFPNSSYAIEYIFQFINLFLIIFVIVFFVILLKIIFKLNKALDIWIKKNK